MSNHQPSKIRLRNQGRSLILDYGTGKQTELDAEYLRVQSPSAEVQGHGGEGGVLPTGKQDVQIAQIEKAGNYALRLHFSDGHDSGIYTWSYLKQLGNEQQQRWQAYLLKLKTLGITREPELQVVRFVDPANSTS